MLLGLWFVPSASGEEAVRSGVNTPATVAVQARAGSAPAEAAPAAGDDTASGVTNATSETSAEEAGEQGAGTSGDTGAPAAGSAAAAGGGAGTDTSDAAGPADASDTSDTSDTSGAVPAAGSAPGTGADAGRAVYLADTGSVDTTPYVTGGLLFLGVGAALVLHSVRRAGGAEEADGTA
ncbi:hypothetical protein GCM10010406_32380 [Streptomyces thermolineatus]|uniref:Gram-positive cocci surface proteins LPxTG domain-containing protein n=1 Tax=Streptomyces thermolineatus TaxID=44033 RepID=A0ABP5ZAZ9_9ACTN